MIVEKELSYQIIAAAMEVHKELGPGFLESVYEAAMKSELEARGHTVEVQRRVPVFYKQHKIGEHVLDQVVDNKIVLELKAVTGIAPIHKQQALSYLKASGFSLAIVINFCCLSLQSARVVFSGNIK